MPATNFNIRLDDALRAKSFAVIESYGMTPSQAVKLFLNQIAVTKTLPLSFTYQKDNEQAEFEQVAMQSLQSYQETGLHITHDEFKDWISDLEAGNIRELPVCHV